MCHYPGFAAALGRTAPSAPPIASRVSPSPIARAPGLGRAAAHRGRMAGQLERRAHVRVRRASAPSMRGKSTPPEAGIASCARRQVVGPLLPDGRGWNMPFRREACRYSPSPSCGSPTGHRECSKRLHTFTIIPSHRLSRLGCRGRGAELLRSAQIDHMLTCSAMARASSTSIPR